MEGEPVILSHGWGAAYAAFGVAAFTLTAGVAAVGRFWPRRGDDRHDRTE